MRRYCILFICALFLAPTAFADTNAIIDQILAETQISYAHAAWLACNAANLVPDTSSPSDAVKVAQTRGWAVPGNPESTAATMGDYSFMLINALGLKAGILYKLAPGARYAFRELLYLKAVHSTSWPTETLNGEEAMRILQKVMDIKEKQR